MQAGSILINYLTAEPSWPSHFAFGMLITLVAAIFGCLFTWVFFIPSKKLVIDTAAQAVHVTYRYPFGFRQDDVFALGDISPPDVVWHKNVDSAEGGFWELKLTLPDGRSITRSSVSPSLTKQ